MDPESKHPKHELSPMDPPEAYKPQSTVTVSYEEMHPFLQELMKDHERIKAALDKFETSVIAMKEKGITREISESLKEFFQFFSEEFIAHDKREEKGLFPLLAKKLIKKGEHSHGPVPTTSVDVMEDDHLKAVQLTAVIFNFFGLASQLKDEVSHALVMDAAIEQSFQLVELMRLHIFREDTILFPLAHQCMEPEEFNGLQSLRRTNLEK